MKKILSVILIFHFSFFTLHLKAQTISLTEARKMAVENYPSLKAARLRTESQKSLKASAFDLGETEISTGAEEKGHNNPDGITNVITVRQNLDILGIGAKSKLVKTQTSVAEAEANVAEQELQYEVSIDYALAYIAQRRVAVYQQLDSIYRNFEHAAEVRYKAEACNRLEYLSAQNQARQITLALNQAKADEEIALLNLNRWLGEATTYKAQDISTNENVIDVTSQSASLLLAQKQVDLAEQKMKVEKSAFLPKFYAEYGSQKIGSTSGYYSWQVGLSVPLVFGAQASRTKSARLEWEASQADLSAAERELATRQNHNLAEYRKWKESVEYYKQTALPLAEEQQHAALRYYQEGQTDYIGFIQNMKDAMQTKFDYLDCYSSYLISYFNHEYNK